MKDRLFLAGISFARSFVGLMIRPYEAMRRVVDHGSLFELPYIAALLALYFATASLVRTAAFRPFLLTRQFVLLGAAAGITFLVVVSVLWFIGQRVGGNGKPGRFLLAWAYTLLPTLAWFWATSLLYVILPPPRTLRPQGIAYSILYLVFSATLLYWKVTLAYLAMRFGMKLDLRRILVVFVISLPVLFSYSYGMYRLGIFKVPFL